MWWKCSLKARENTIELSRIIDFKISRDRPSIMCRQHYFFLSLFVSPPFFTTATESELRVWYALLILLSANASASRIVGVLFFRKVCVSHVLSARVSLSPQNIHVFRALVYFLSVFIPVGFFFIREHPQIHSPRRIILLIRYSHFYALHVFPINYWYFSDINNLQVFNNYSSGIYLKRWLYAVFHLFIEIKVFYKYMKTLFSVLFREKFFVFTKTFYQTFSINTLIVEEFYIEKFFFLCSRIL